MKKVINITLSGKIFSIEEDAYQKLSGYLSDIASYYQKKPEMSEVVDDIESAIRDHFIDKMSAHHAEVLTIDDVSHMIETMGTVHEFETESKESEINSSHDQENQAVKRLYRDPKNMILGGVCSGLGHYFQLDPIVFRIAFVLATIFGGWGILVYIIFWLVTPEAKTIQQKLEMEGNPVTLEHIQENVKTAAEQLKKKTKESVEHIKKNEDNIRNIFLAPFRALGIVLRSLSPILLKFFQVVGAIIGVACIISSVILMTVCIGSLISLIMNKEIIENLHFLMIPIQYNALIIGISTLIIIGIPLLALLHLGIHLAFRTWYLKTSTTLIIGCLWLVALITGLFLAVDNIPTLQKTFDQIDPDSEKITQNISVNNFDQIDIGGTHNITIHQGPTATVRVTGTEKALTLYNLYVTKNHTLTVKHRNTWSCLLWCSIYPLHIDITVTDLEKINLSGSTHTQTDALQLNKIDVSVSGASTLDSNMHVVESTFEISGASEVELHGTAETSDIEVSGASTLNAENFIVQDADIDISGASHGIISVIRSLIAQASGASDLIYIGNPHTDTEVSGASEIIQQ